MGSIQAWGKSAGQARHGKAVLPRAEAAGFVPRVSRGHDVESVQRVGVDGRLRNAVMGEVRGVKSPAEKPEAHQASQSRGTRKSFMRRSSGEPGSAWRW